MDGGMRRGKSLTAAKLPVSGSLCADWVKVTKLFSSSLLTHRADGMYVHRNSRGILCAYEVHH